MDGQADNCPAGRGLQREMLRALWTGLSATALMSRPSVRNGTYPGGLH